MKYSIERQTTGRQVHTQRKIHACNNLRKQIDRQTDGWTDTHKYVQIDDTERVTGRQMHTGKDIYTMINVLIHGDSDIYRYRNM